MEQGSARQLRVQSSAGAVAETGAPELRVEGLVKRYTPQVSIGPISFEVYPGEYLSLLGPSGCGKTTTLRCIAGFETLSAGAIHLGYTRLDRVPAHKRNVGLVFQNYALFPHLNVYDNVAFGLRLARVERRELDRRVGAMLDLVGLGEVRQRLPHQLSGGQQQRVAIARAVIMEPRVILFDEPLSNLDLKLRLQMRRELRELQRRLGKTTIYVTHDQTEALALSDRIAVLSHGRIEQVGTPREIYERPATEFVANFIGTANLVKAQTLGVTDGRLSVEVGQGLRLLADWKGPVPGRSLLLMLRPERIRIGQRQNGPVENGFRGSLRDVTYLGEDLLLSVQVDPSLEFIVSTKSDASSRALAPGAQLDLSVAAADLHVLPT